MKTMMTRVTMLMVMLALVLGAGCVGTDVGGYQMSANVQRSMLRGAGDLMGTVGIEQGWAREPELARVAQDVLALAEDGEIAALSVGMYEMFVRERVSVRYQAFGDSLIQLLPPELRVDLARVLTNEQRRAIAAYCVGVITACEEFEHDDSTGGGSGGGVDPSGPVGPTGGASGGSDPAPSGAGEAERGRGRADIAACGRECESGRASAGGRADRRGVARVEPARADARSV